MTWLENGIYLLAWPLALIFSLFAMAGLLHVAGWLFDEPIQDCVDEHAEKPNPL